MAEQKKEKPSTKGTREVLLVLAKKIKIMDEQAISMRVLIDELEERIIQLEERAYDDREVVFKQDFDWD